MRLLTRTRRFNFKELPAGLITFRRYSGTIKRKNFLFLVSLLEEYNQGRQANDLPNSAMFIDNFALPVFVVKRQNEGLTHVDDLHCHETYYAGQLELLRQLVEINDQIF